MPARLRVDISEGAEEWEIPALGYGRIRSIPEIREWYATVRLRGRRLFIASGLYGGRRRGFRWRWN